MSGYELLKTLHVLSAMCWFGGGLYYAIVYQYLWRAADRRELLAMVHRLDRVGTPFFIATAIATLVFGVWNVATSDVWAFSDAWVLIGLAGLVVAMALGAFAGSTLTQRMHGAAEQRGPDHADVARHARSIIVIGYVEMVVLVAVVFVMVAKPGT